MSESPTYTWSRQSILEIKNQFNSLNTSFIKTKEQFEDIKKTLNYKGSQKKKNGEFSSSLSWAESLKKIKSPAVPGLALIAQRMSKGSDVSSDESIGGKWEGVVYMPNLAALQNMNKDSGSESDIHNSTKGGEKSRTSNASSFFDWIKTSKPEKKGMTNISINRSNKRGSVVCEIMNSSKLKTLQNQFNSVSKRESSVQWASRASRTNSKKSSLMHQQSVRNYKPMEVVKEDDRWKGNTKKIRLSKSGEHIMKQTKGLNLNLTQTFRSSG